MTIPIEIAYDYAGVPTLERFSRSNAMVRGLVGAFGSGKSSACVIEIVNRALAQAPGPDGIRRSRWGVVRNTYAELRDTTIRTVMQWLPEHHFGRYVQQRHSYMVRAFAGVEFEILFLALDRPDDIKKLLSLELTGAWVNEAREVPWAVIDALQGRIGRYPSKQMGGPSWYGMWMDTNPPDSDSRWYKFFEDRLWLADFTKMRNEGNLPADMKAEDYAQIFKQPSGLAANAENIENLPGGKLYYARLAAGKAREWVKVYVHGEYGFVVEGKLVFPEYADSVHCRDDVDPVPGVPIIRGWDFGLTPSCIFGQLLPDGRLLVFDEMTSDNMGIDQFSDDVLTKCTRSFRGGVTFEDWGDPAGLQRSQVDARTCFDIMHGKGIEVQGADQSPVRRQESVRKVLRSLAVGEPQFILHSRCKMLRKGFLGGYHRRRLQTPGIERYSESPDKNLYSHPHDALQYLTVSYFGEALSGGELDDDMDGMFQGDWEGVDPSRSEVTGY